jgi:hypothetical protein
VGGQVFAVAFWLVVLFAVNVYPGWHTLPLLSSAAASVLWLVNLCIVARIIAHLVYLVDDAGRYRPIGDYVIALIDLVLAAELLRVFPFDFGEASEWATTVQILLLTGVVWSGLRAGGAAVRIAHRFRAMRLATRSA